MSSDILLQKILSSPLTSFLLDQRLRELLSRREFRITEDYVRREILSRSDPGKISDLQVSIRENVMEISGKAHKKLLPVPIPFSVRFSVHSLDFSGRRKTVNLSVDRIAPLDGDWLRRKLTENIPYLVYENGIVSCDLREIPAVAKLFDITLKGIRPMEFVVIEDLRLHDGEIVGRIGIST